MTWYGRGPAETYVDRAFERVGVYSSTVGAEWVEYSRPQANGNKVDVRWVEFTNDKGVGLRVEGMPLAVASRRITPAGGDVEQAAYTWQIDPAAAGLPQPSTSCRWAWAGSTAGRARRTRWSPTGSRPTSRTRIPSACVRSSGGRRKPPVLW